MYHKNNNNGLLLEQISNYIKHAPYRRIKRSGSLGLSDNSVRNLMVFEKLIRRFRKAHRKSNYVKWYRSHVS